MTGDLPRTASAPGRPPYRRLTVHLFFVWVLLFIVALKYYLYFGSEVTGTGVTATRVGATTGHLLLWFLAYSMCLGTTRPVVMGALAAPTLFLGVLTYPILGYAGLIVMFVVYRWIKKKDRPVRPRPSGF